MTTSSSSQQVKSNNSSSKDPTKRKPFGWMEKIKSISDNKANRIKDAEKAKLKYEKDLAKWNKDQEKLKLDNASAAEKMKMNWQKYREEAIKAFSGNYNSNISQPGQPLPSVPKKPIDPSQQFNPMQGESLGPKLASTLSNLGSRHIEGIIKHASQMRKLNNLIKFIEYAKSK